MTSGVPGFGTFLIWNYRKVLEILSISGPSQSRDTIDVTSHGSTDKFREFIAGPIAGGEVSLDGNLIVGDTYGQIAFHTDVQGGTKRNCFIVMPMAVGGALSFEAFAKGFEGSYPFDDKIGISGSLQVTGKPTLLTAQSTGMTGLTGYAWEDIEKLPLVIAETPLPGTYAYTAPVVTTTTHVKITPVADTHTIYAQGVLLDGESDKIALG
ncbi:MAG TPA: phage tail tube protein, partial [Dehalococcoidales bacterium]|nr:phage tail tube protein [Dehalococcoidales bacterium]